MVANVVKRTSLFAVLALVSACVGQHATSLLPNSAVARHHGRAMDQSANYAAVILGDNPTGYYRLDDTGAVAADSSGNGYYGTRGCLGAGGRGRD